MRNMAFLACIALVALAMPVLMTPASAFHTGVRIVMPFGQSERYHPVVAGYEVVPRPLGCDVGTVDATSVLYEQDFEGDVSDVRIAKELKTSFHDDPAYYRNLWHVTHAIANEKGTNEGHSGTGRLYFGISASGSMRPSWERLAGTATFPAFTIPAEPSYLTWNDKFEVEGLFGYDHLWVEIVDQADGKVYLLCSTDTDVRPDKSSNDNEFSTCSPYRTMLCPTGVHGDGGLQCPGAQVTPFYYCLPTFIDFEDAGLNQIDPTAPHWERRYVQLPQELIGHTVKPRFAYDSSDGVANAYLGWIGDDFRVVTGEADPEPYAYVAPTPAAPQG